MKRFLFFFLLSVCFSSDQIPGLEQKRPILLRGGILYTVSGDILAGHDLLFANGKIVTIGEDIQPSPDTDVYDIHEKHVVPGYIAPLTQIGLVEIGAVKQTRDYSETGDINPNVRANVSYNPDSELIPVTRSNGVLIANSVPLSGLIAGQSSCMMMDGWTWEDATLNHPTALHLNWPNMRLNFSKTAKKKEKQQREAYQKKLREIDRLIRDTRAYHLRTTQKERKAEQKQETDLRLAALTPYFVEQQQIIVRADDVRQIEAAVLWADKYDLKITISGGRDAWRLPELLVKHNVPVILQHVQTTPRRRFEPVHTPYRTPALLQKEGVKFCLSTDQGYPFNGHVRTLPNEAMRAAAWGLAKAEALRSITLSTAEILGVDKRVGSLEPGKDATFFITNDPPLQITTNPIKAYIMGREVDLGDRQKMLYEKYKEKYRRQGRLE